MTSLNVYEMSPSLHFCITYLMNDLWKRFWSFRAYIRGRRDRPYHHPFLDIETRPILFLSCVDNENKIHDSFYYKDKDESLSWFFCFIYTISRTQGLYVLASNASRKQIVNCTTEIALNTLFISIQRYHNGTLIYFDNVLCEVHITQVFCNSNEWFRRTLFQVNCLISELYIKL